MTRARHYHIVLFIPQGKRILDSVTPASASLTLLQLTDGMQESFIPGAEGSASGPGWWSAAEEVFRMEG
jgi:hypothetical protein